MLYVLGELSTKIVPFIMLPFLTYNLTGDGFGSLVMFQVYQALFLALFNSGVDVALNRYYIRYGKRSYRFVFNLSFFIPSFLFILVFIALCMVDAKSLLLWGAVAAYFNSLFVIVISFFQITKSPLIYVLLSVLASVLSAFFTIVLFLSFDQAVYYRFVSVCCGFLLAFLASILMYYKVGGRFSYAWRGRYFLYFLGFCLPVLPHNIALFIRNYADRFFIEDVYSVSELGVYSAAFQLAGIISVILVSINKALTPEIFERFKQGIGLRFQLRFIVFILLVEILMGVFIYCIPSNVFGLIFGEGFSGIKEYLLILSLGLTLQAIYLYYVNFFFYNGYTKVITVSTVLSSVVYLGYIYMVVEYSIYAVAFGVAISSLISSLILAVYYNKVIYR